MISRILVKNYQSLQNLELKLGKFTVIVGESDSGKSALIRALTGWATNQAGSDFTTHGKSSTSVLVEMDSGDVVGWVKPKNSYVVNGKEYAKAGRECPAEVKAVTGFIDVVFDEDYSDLLNIAGQFDPPFLVTLSGTKVAKVIGKVSGIEFLYNAQRIISKETAATRSNIVSLELLIESLKKQLSAFEGVDKERESLEKIKQVFDRIAKETALTVSLASILEDIGSSTSRVSSLEKELELLPDVEKAMIFDTLESKLNEVNEIRSVLTQIVSSTDSIAKLRVSVSDANVDEVNADIELQTFWNTLNMCPLCERELTHA